MYHSPQEIEKIQQDLLHAITEYQTLAKDLDWRIPDVEGEYEILQQLKKDAETNPSVSWHAQQITYDVLKKVLDAKIARSEELEARIKELKQHLDQLTQENTIEEEETPPEPPLP